MKKWLSLLTFTIGIVPEIVVTSLYEKQETANYAEDNLQNKGYNNQYFR